MSASVLEKHHAKFGLCILQENGLSNALELKDWEFVRDCFLKLIPATDITYQGVYQKQFKVSWSVSSFFQLFLAYLTNNKSKLFDVGLENFVEFL
ncbi:unnamed protein product [Schistosoma margrebowiei]|uniref:Uncharacterized protein n=1 Tax=Schistosoma margrebowiei TaxID=48269 RepID=A0A183LTI3_9TREM|nr:unnamed protein product [Schistosoma margrebowiei]